MPPLCHLSCQQQNLFVSPWLHPSSNTNQIDEDSNMLFTTEKEDFPLVDEKDQLKEQQIKGYKWCENWSCASTID